MNKLEKRTIFKPFTNPIIAPIVIVSLIVSLLLLWYLPISSFENEKNTIKKDTVDLVDKIQAFRDYYNNEILPKIEAHSNLEVDYDHRDSDTVVPLPATVVHNLGEILSKENNEKFLEINFFSNYPFPNRADRVLDEKQKEAIEFLDKHPDEIFVTEDVIDGKDVYRISIADVFNSQNCVDCHNNLSYSPKRDWRLGDTRGVIEVISPANKGFILTPTQTKIMLGLVLITILGLILHYVRVYLKREKENKNKNVMLEQEIFDRTKELTTANELLKRYKQSIDISSIVSKWDKNGMIKYVNHKYSIISGYDIRELIGQKYDFVYFVDKDKKNEVFETIKKGDIFKGILKKRNKSGSIYYVATTVVPINDYFGNLLEYLSISYDITELIKSREKAELDKKGKSIFLANMSHEIRTPLNAIIGFANVLCESNLNKNDRENVEIITQSAKSLLSIINAILDISKIESGKFDIVNEKVIFRTFIENIVKLFNGLASDKNIDFTCKIDEKIPQSFSFDSTRLQQVLSNLLSNAIKFTPNSGKVSLNISLVELKENVAKVYFSVEDSGVGMTPKQQKNIFEPYSQADEHVSKNFGGTGLGLTICSEIINLMNSKIEVFSELDKGTKFEFSLDLEIVENSENKNDEKNKYNFLIYSPKGISDGSERTLQYHLKEIGLVDEYKLDEEQKADMLFCFVAKNLKEVVSKFKKSNPTSLVISVREDDSTPFTHIFDDKLMLPIYGSKVFDLVSNSLKIDNIKKDEDVVMTPVKLKGKILVVEDNINNQKLIEILLKKQNLEFEIASNGEEAIKAYKKNQYDLILMDINMPIVDGIEATKEILRLQRDEGRYKVPIVALTANSVAGDREKYISIGMDNYLTKPIDFNNFVSVLSIYLSDDNSSICLTSKEIAQFLNIPYETANRLFTSFCDTLQGKLVNLQKQIELLEKEAIKESINDLIDSCIMLNFTNTVSILEELEQVVDLDNKDTMMKIFVKLKENLENIKK